MKKNKQPKNISNIEMSFVRGTNVVYENEDAKERHGISKKNGDKLSNSFASLTREDLSLCEKLNFSLESKFTLKHARTVDNDSFTDDKLTSHDQIPNYIINMLMIADYHAREFILKPINLSEDDKVYDKFKDVCGFDSDDDELNSGSVEGINPMDALLGIFHCCDNFLRRELAVKLSACQLSVPFILPHPDMPEKCVTILLSSLEKITKSWRGVSTDAKKVYATEHPFPVVSFIRLGKVTMSKSSLMNKIISDGNGDHDFFFHKNIKGGNVERKVVDGLVELVWYLPSANDKNTLKKEICFANLRGDAHNFKKQVKILGEISNILCIILPSEMPDERMINFLEKMPVNGKTIYIFGKKVPEEVKKCYVALNNQRSKKFSVITKAHKANEYNFYESIRKKIQSNLQEAEVESLVNKMQYSKEVDVYFYDDKASADLVKTVETWITLGIHEIKNLFKLQSHVQVLADLERKKYNPKFRRSNEKSTRQNDIAELYKQIEDEKDSQRCSFYTMNKDVLSFLNSIVELKEVQRNENLHQVKHFLDKTSLSVMAKLHQEYRQATLSLQKKSKEFNEDPERSHAENRLKKLEALISKSSFSLEHIIRELAQLYLLSNDVTNNYAGAAADILLSGHPLELLDGDAGYIPLQWFDAVYKELECKTNNSRIFVVSVFGIQSSGKSTMLNTMFGLEFPVSVGRCTRGAFASLVPVSYQLKTVSNVGFLLIIDTEGLRGTSDPKLREHDNELATFAIGVADITIINVFGENQNEMKEFLQIAVHAFLKMKLVNKKKFCKIVHQNVAAADANEKLMTDRHNLKQDLDKMAKLAAIYENCEDKFQKFDDIIAFDENEDVFYMPSLLKGSPPMTPINPDYGSAVLELKKNIIKFMCSKDVCKNSISEFRDRVKILWEAMLKENFIFSFQNVIEVIAFTSLDKMYFEEYVKNLVNGMAEIERIIQLSLTRCSTLEERSQQWLKGKIKIRESAKEFQRKMENSIKSFIENSEDRSTLEQWEENVMNRIEQHKENHQTTAMRSCQATFNHLQQLQEVEDKKQKYKKQLLERARTFIASVQNTGDLKKCKAAFQQLWEPWIDEVPAYEEQKKDVNSEMVDVLCDTNRAFNVVMESKLKDKEYIIVSFDRMDPFIDANKISIQQSILQKFGSLMGFGKNEAVVRAKNIKDEAVSKGIAFAKDTSKTAVRYSRDHLTRMYHEVTSTIEKASENERFKFKKELICDILIYTFACTVKIFDEMEKHYVEERDIRRDLQQNFRPRLETYFVNLVNEMEKEVLAANSLVDVLLEPIKSELNKTMGPAVTGELLTKSMFQSKGPYHASVLIQLGEKGMFDLFVPYFENPVKFLKKKLQESVEDYCLKRQPSMVRLLVRKETQKIKSNITTAIEFASQEARREMEKESGKFKVINWIRYFVQKCSTLAITNEMFGVATINEDLKNIDVFETKIRKRISEFVKTLELADVDSETIGKWDPAPHEILFPAIFGCQCVCPFCKGLCDQTIEGHPGNHSTRIHRPPGLTGYRYQDTQILSSNMCTSLVAGNSSFRNFNTGGKWYECKDYQSVNDYYKSWTIPPDPSFEPSKYWQWFMVKFSKELAEHYEAKEPYIPSAWKNVTFKDAKEQLQETYKL
ncbi:interferon-induced very large GTPase 1-like [Xenia sp. Carnegie-2017]|uniref:interferon-induced very large GTPase 1-like n=1 Tax=Xenia sp. Carnegie-2017 TaxID=2897299 RepID=UPI001F043B4D|nr:interferon-induced very large GTPase 1-like [Xenia sp. Carnegie-2017]